MIKLAANISYLYCDRPFLDRFEAAAIDGFRYIEWMFAYDYDLDDLRRGLKDHGQSLTLVNTPAGNLDKGDLGLAVSSDRRDELIEAFDQALEHSISLGSPLIHFLAGRPSEGQSFEESDSIFLENLKWAADKAAKFGKLVTLEPLNPIDRPGYHLLSNEHAFRLIERSGRSNVRLQIDMFHCQKNEGAVIPALKKYFDILEYVQIAGVPDRSEPSRGELDYREALFALNALNYEGFVGCEYSPAGDTTAGLEWARPYIASA